MGQMSSASSYACFDERQGNEAGTNVVEINMGCNSAISQLETGDPITCRNCECLLNSFSKPVRLDQNIHWKCEFCASDNTILAEDEELPKLPAVTYMLESSNQVAQRRQGVDDDSTLIFCIDISGSMCISKPVQGNLCFKTNRRDQMLNLLQEGDDRNIDTRVTYVSRLECVQGAIEAQLNELKTGTPSKKVGLVTFNREVKVVGDGSGELVITGDKLNSSVAIRTAVEGKHPEFFNKSISDSAPGLIQKVISIEEDGPTALGPALFASVILASEGGAGSKVILCTDGLANLGIGNFESDEAADQFYREVGNLACEKGVSVSVISIEGDECRLESLAALTEETGGSVLKVAPERLSEEFGNILTEDVVATQVVAKVTLHPALEFRGEEPHDLKWNKSRLTRKIGNATANSSLSFEYCLKSADVLERERINIEGLETVVMQASIEYMSMDGMKLLRSITLEQPITRNARQAREHSKFDILAKNCNKKVNKLVQKGKLSSAKKELSRWQAALEEVPEEAQDVKHEFDDYAGQIEQVIMEQKIEEEKEGLMVDSDDEDQVSTRKNRYKDKVSAASRFEIAKKKRKH